MKHRRPGWGVYASNEMSSPAETTRGYEEIADWTKSVVGATLILNPYNVNEKIIFYRCPRPVLLPVCLTVYLAR